MGETIPRGKPCGDEGPPRPWLEPELQGGAGRQWPRAPTLHPTQSWKLLQARWELPWFSLTSLGVWKGRFQGACSEPPEGQEGLGQSFLSDWRLRAAAEQQNGPWSNQC